eukprot:5483998-Prymnesium_polylepis.1
MAQLDARRACVQLKEARDAGRRAQDGAGRSDEPDDAGGDGGVKDKWFGGVGAVGELKLCRQAARRVGAKQVEGGWWRRRRRWR